MSEIIVRKTIMVEIHASVQEDHEEAYSIKNKYLEKGYVLQETWTPDHNTLYIKLNEKRNPSKP